MQLKTNVIVNMLEDVRLNMEALGEHKALMDHVMANVNRLGEMVQESQSTLRALQTERELAERIDRGNKQLRAKTTGGRYEADGVRQLSELQLPARSLRNAAETAATASGKLGSFYGFSAIFFLKYSSVLVSPSSSGTFGSQPSSVRARVMSGCRTFGSSSGSGR